MTSDVEQPPIPRPEGLPQGWTVRLPELADLEVLVKLRGADRLAWTGSASVDREAIESEVAGPASWTRRQLLAVDPEGTPRAWIIVHDRAARRTMVMLYVDRTVDEAGVLAGVLYAWAEQQAGEISALREVSETRLDASPFAEDTVQQQWLTDAGYTKRRIWPQMTRPVTPEEATSAARTPRGRHHPPGRQPRERPPDRERPAARPRDARVVLRGPLQLLPRELPGVRPAAPRGPRPPLGPLVARVRRGGRGRAARCWCRGEHGPAGERRGSRGQLHRVHRRAPSCSRPRCRQVAAPHRDRRRSAAWTGPGRARGRRRTHRPAPTGSTTRWAGRPTTSLESWFKELDFGQGPASDRDRGSR